MSSYRVKGLPPIKLENLLKKRRTTLKKFLKDTGIVTYATLLQKAESMGVAPPSEDVFKEAVGDIVSSPQEGVVVLEPPRLLKESGQSVDIDVDVYHATDSHDPVQQESSASVVLEEAVDVAVTSKFQKKKGK